MSYEAHRVAKTEIKNGAMRNSTDERNIAKMCKIKIIAAA